MQRRLVRHGARIERLNFEIVESSARIAAAGRLDEKLVRTFTQCQRADEQQVIVTPAEVNFEQVHLERDLRRSAGGLGGKGEGGSGQLQDGAALHGSCWHAPAGGLCRIVGWA